MRIAVRRSPIQPETVRRRGRVAASLLDGTDSLAEQTFLHRCRLAGLPEPHVQVQIIRGRRWRWDFAWPDCVPPVVVEINGGQWSGGRHIRPGSGYEGDLRKANAANAAGYVVLAFTPAMVESGEAIRLIAEILRGGN